MHPVSFLDRLDGYINWASGHLWNDLLIILLLGSGLFFTLTTSFVQFRLFGRGVKEMFYSRKNGGYGITPFQAFVTGLAARVGTGNIAGVAIAISSGGPGAVLWMWLTALIGMSCAFAESSLAQLFKVRDRENNLFYGGPAYYITRGLGQRWRWMAVLFALALILCYGFVFNSVQANTIAESIVAWQWNKQIVAVALALLTMAVIFGGIRRIAKVAEALVPLMAFLYLLLAFYIVLSNLAEVPGMFTMIIDDAFTAKSATGGIFGGLISIAMMNGIKRGLHSNEAGMGSAPNAAAAADVYHPVSQGLIQMFGVFVDTFIVCSCTAFIILIAPLDGGQEGIQLTQAALVHHVGHWSLSFLTICVFLFCYSSILGNYAYAEANVHFLNSSKTTMTVFRLLVIAMVYFGAETKMTFVWNSADLVMGIMTTINLVAILLLSPYVWLLLGDYKRQLKSGSREPVFRLADYPRLRPKVTKDIW